MAKPTNLPRWAETTGGAPSADITEPSSGQKDAGWVNGDPVDAEQWNWILWTVYLWIKWLDGTITTKQTKRVARRRSVPLAPARLIKTSDSTEVATAAGVFVRSVDLGGAPEVYTNTDTPRLVIPIALDEDEQLEEVKARVSPQGATMTVDMKVFRLDAGVASPGAGAFRTQLGATQTSAASGSPNYQTLDLSGLTELIDGEAEAGEFYSHVIEFSAGVFDTGYAVHDVSIYTSVPTPP